MSILPILTVPDPILRQSSTAIETVDDETRRLVKNMLDTMYDAPGVGLAAIQIGVPKRVVVIDTGGPDGATNDPWCMINPEIVWWGDAPRQYEEGCLSLPDVLVEIERPADVRVRYVDPTGTLQERSADGLLATAIQHELDHLDGKLIIDFLSPLKREIVVRRLRKSKRIG